MTEVPPHRGGDRLPAGKMPAADLAELLARAAVPHPRLLVGPRVGEDAAVIDVGSGRCLVVTTDPVTFVTERAGWYAVHVNANDVAAMGARPLWFFAVVLMPEACRRDEVEAVVEEIAATCTQLGVTLAGGHTEITIGIDRPIVVGQMVGEVDRSAVIAKAGLRAGDRVVLTRGAAIEGTAILAREMGQALAERLDPDVLAAARDLLVTPGISVVDAARVATAAADVHAMHDPTEGGVLTGLHEMAVAAGLGLRVWAERIPVLPETRAVCGALHVDPLALIASGALLVAVPGDEVERLLEALALAGIGAAVVAEARPREEGILLERAGTWLPLQPPSRDEIARVLGSG